ncbi:hypothetical protein Btru_055351 [Bulinus truncatus]|nr:hypothetical protein Btru_055351 [Bulinus truncatus]
MSFASEITIRVLQSHVFKNQNFVEVLAVDSALNRLIFFLIVCQMIILMTNQSQILKILYIILNAQKPGCAAHVFRKYCTSNPFRLSLINKLEQPFVTTQSLGSVWNVAARSLYDNVLPK